MNQPKLPDYQKHAIKKSALLRPLRRGLQVWLARAVFGMAPYFPVRWSQAVGRRVGGLFYLLAKRERRVALEQLAMAFPDKGAEWRQATCRAVFQHFGMTLFEVLSMARIRAEAHRWVEDQGAEQLQKAYGQGKGVILLVGHMANWELISVVFDRYRIRGRAMMSHMADPRLTELLLRARRSAYMDVLPRGDSDSPRLLLAALKAGEVLAIAMDQELDNKGLFVPFFGRPAYTPRVAASLALKMDIPVVRMFGVRRPDGSHLLRYQPVERPPGLKADQEGIQALTAHYTKLYEDHLRIYPEQWAWFHRRWRKQPGPQGD